MNNSTNIDHLLDVAQADVQGNDEDDTIQKIKAFLHTMSDDDELDELANDQAAIREIVDRARTNVINSANQQFAEGWIFIDIADREPSPNGEGNPRYVEDADHDDVLMKMDVYQSGTKWRFRLAWKVEGILK